MTPILEHFDTKKLNKKNHKFETINKNNLK
jgi:hypothetical protein